MSRNDDIRSQADRAMQLQELRRARLYIEVSIENHLVTAGVDATITLLEIHIQHLREFEPGNHRGSHGDG